MSTETVRLLTLDPGHFHAALVQKEMYEGVSPEVHVYAPLGPDVVSHLHRIIGFNTRKQNPTSWHLEVHAGSDYRQLFLRDRPGNVVVLAGRNHLKIHYILEALQAGINVLADKPWIITADDLPRLQAALDHAERSELIAYDIMTERHEITSILQRELVNDPAIFGVPVAGTVTEPAVEMASMHYLSKSVAGVPLRRPPWFFDVEQQGEGLTDVGTHLVDLVFWILFPEESIDYRSDIRIVAAKRWPTVLTKSDFQKVTGEAEFPEYLAPQLRSGELSYFCNTLVSYTVRGTYVQLDIRWDYEAAPGSGDTHSAVFRGSQSAVEIRQEKEQNYRPELYVLPCRPGDKPGVLAAVQRKIDALRPRYPDLTVEPEGDRLHVVIPEKYRIGHEAHFAEVTRQFLGYLRQPKSSPAWEKSVMLAKYYVTTQGVAVARQLSV
ncbi:MAG TPA: putative oxidoreductase C-terminal domain-containing protein [Gemmataceae bacterium]|nr:putative oxidoreductase C-terminal domain-containing protein [Gemmataceae bacterium]